MENNKESSKDTFAPCFEVWDELERTVWIRLCLSFMTEILNFCNLLFINFNNKIFKLKFLTKMIRAKETLAKRIESNFIDMEPNMEAPVSVEKHVTTVFIDEGPSIVKEGDADYEVSYRTEMTNIKDMLAKDYYVSTYTWTNSSANTTLVSVDPVTVISTSVFANKLAGFNLLRCKMHLTIKINASPFQQGALIIRYLPSTDAYGANWLATRTINLTTKTQQPSIIMLANQTSAELIIPFISPADYYDILNSPYNMGKFYIDVMSPLLTGLSGVDTVDITTYIRFTELELSAPMVPNSMSSKEASAVSSTGSISKGLRVAAKVAHTLSAIPSLAQYTAPTAWALDRAAGVASHFGYAHPQMDQPLMPVATHGFRDMATSDGVDGAYKLAVLRQNEVKVLKDVTPRTEDEMSMRWLLSREAYLQSLTWTTSTSQGASLYGTFVSPSTLYAADAYASGAKTATYHTGPPVWYLSPLFRFCRGSLKLRLQFIKTQFHTGRLEIIWQPTYDGASTPTDTTLCLREVVDIRFADEVDLLLPYILPFNYQTTLESVGRIQIKVLNELRAPETVSATINVLMFWSAGPDFEFAAPINNTTNVYPPLMVGNSDPLPTEVIGGEYIPPPTLQYSQRSVGEYITSVKQLTNRNCAFSVTNSPTWTGLTICPWFFGLASTTSGTVVGTSPGGDCISYIGLMYGMFRGSMNVTVHSTTFVASNAVRAYLQAPVTAFIGSNPNSGLQPGLTNVAWTTPGSRDQFQSGIFLLNGQQNVATATVPYYNQTRASLVCFSITNAMSDVDSSVPNIGITFDTAGSANAAAYRSTADDFQFSYFLGCPPILYSLA